MGAGESRWLVTWLHPRFISRASITDPTDVSQLGDGRGTQKAGVDVGSRAPLWLRLSVNQRQAWDDLKVLSEGDVYANGKVLVLQELLLLFP
ncbi:hypothetical protein BaRGS_00025869 [Batillaria attramentaria]|uniref:Uncharacterized protein n=1 Tax=Batillaria attramentaria TaxID=370345 RepID=A0ABD0K7H0_9CAEN